jgi:uncharacterized protein
VRSIRVATPLTGYPEPDLTVCSTCAVRTLPSHQPGQRMAVGHRRVRSLSSAVATDRHATVVVFNGNAGERSLRAPLAAALNRTGFSVLLFDYRGYGRNPGSPSERGLLNDAGAARAYVIARDDVNAGRLVYFGESLGAAVAVGLAAEYPPAALVLRSPFTSLADMGRLYYPLLPTNLLLRDRFDLLGRIGRLSCPVLIVVGYHDRIVPPDQSRRLYDAAPEPKRFVVIQGADHNDFELLAGDLLIGEVTRFVNEALTLTFNSGTGPRI